LFSPSNHKGFNGLFAIEYSMDRKRRFVHAVGPFGREGSVNNSA